MRTLARTTLLAILAFVLVTPLVHASKWGDCDSKGSPALGLVTVDTPVGTFYVDDRNYVMGNGLWIYMECNNVAGLQRGGSSPIVPDDSEICSDDSPSGPDCLIV